MIAGEPVNAARALLGSTRKQLAERAGLSATAIGEQGGNRKKSLTLWPPRGRTSGPAMDKRGQSHGHVGRVRPREEGGPIGPREHCGRRHADRHQMNGRLNTPFLTNSVRSRTK
jgi:hypothetical protein